MSFNDTDSGLFRGKIIKIGDLNSEVTAKLPSGSFPIQDADIANVSATKLLGGAANQFIQWVAGAAAWVTLALADIVAIMGYTPPNPANYNTANNPAAYGATDLQALAGSDVLMNVVATNATRGFIRISTCAGTPTGIPANGAGALVLDTTNNKLYCYLGGIWTQISGGGSSLSEVQFLASQASLGNLIVVTGNVTATGTVVSYTPATGKTFTLYSADFAIADSVVSENVQIQMDLKNDTTIQASLYGTTAFGASGSQQIKDKFSVKGDQLIGNSSKKYSIVATYSTVDATTKTFANIEGYIA